MKDFSEIRSEWFREQVERLTVKGYSKAEIARKLDVLPQYLTPILNGNRNASENLVLRLCDVFSINQNELLKRMRIYENSTEPNQLVAEPIVKYNASTDSIPLIPIEAAAGYGNGDVQVLESEIQAQYIVPDFKQKGVDFLIRASGSSMYPKYSNGDLLACKRIKEVTFIQWGKVYVLDTEQGAIVKRLFQSSIDDKHIECRSDNREHYPPFDLPRSSIRAVFIVLGVIRME